MKNIPNLQTIFTYLIPFLVFSSLLVDRSQCAPAVEGDEVDGGCYYMFNHYGEGDRILTNEPCLNCTCHNSMLMCYLRVCPFTKPIGQDCTVEKKPDQCCPVISCPQVPVSLVTPSQLTSTTMSTTTSLASVTEQSTELAPYERGCEIDGKFYSDGAQIIGDPSKPCELCYCIRNKTACVMQECILHVEGCDPVFQPGVCCPVRYQCDYPPQITDQSTVAGLITTTLSSIFSPAPLSGSCTMGGKTYADGSQIPGAGPDPSPCEHCYCMRGEIVCAVQECGTPLENEGANCTAIPPGPGLCCPEKYTCESDKQILSDDYMTTILPPAVAEVIDPQDIPSSDSIDDNTNTESPSISNVSEGSGQSTIPPSETQGDETVSTTEGGAVQSTSSTSKSPLEGTDILVGEASGNSSEMEIHNLQQEKPLSLSPLESMGEDKVGTGESDRPIVEGIKNTQLAPEESTENSLLDQPAVTTSSDPETQDAVTTQSSKAANDDKTSAGESGNAHEGGQHNVDSSGSGAEGESNNAASERIPDVTESSGSVELPTEKLYEVSTENTIVDPEITTSAQSLDDGSNKDESADKLSDGVTSSEAQVPSSTEGSSSSSATQESSTESGSLPGAQPVESETSKPFVIPQETSTESVTGSGTDDEASSLTTLRPNVNNGQSDEDTGTEKLSGSLADSSDQNETDKRPAEGATAEVTDKPVESSTAEDTTTKKTVADDESEITPTEKPVSVITVEDSSTDKPASDDTAEVSSTDKPVVGESSTEIPLSSGVQLSETSSGSPSESSVTDSSSIADGIPDEHTKDNKEVEKPTEPSFNNNTDDAAQTTLKPSTDTANLSDENAINNQSTETSVPSQSDQESTTVKGTDESINDAPAESSTDIPPGKVVGDDGTDSSSTDSSLSAQPESSTEKISGSVDENVVPTSTEKSSESSANPEEANDSQSTEQSGVVSTEGSSAAEASSTERSPEDPSDVQSVNNDKPADLSDISSQTEPSNEVSTDSSATESSQADDSVTAASNVDESGQDKETSTETAGLLNKLTNIVNEFFTTTMKSVIGSQEQEVESQADDRAQTTLSPGSSDSPVSSGTSEETGEQTGGASESNQVADNPSTGGESEVTTIKPDTKIPVSQSSSTGGDSADESGSTVKPSGDELPTHDDSAEESATAKPHDHEGIVMGMETVSSTPGPAESLSHSSTSTEKTPSVLPEGSESENEIEQSPADSKDSQASQLGDDAQPSGSSTSAAPVNSSAIDQTTPQSLSGQVSETEVESGVTTLPPGTVNEVQKEVTPVSSDEPSAADDKLESSTTSTGSESATIPSVGSVGEAGTQKPGSDDMASAVIDVSGEEPGISDNKPVESGTFSDQVPEITTIRTTDEDAQKSSSTVDSSDSSSVTEPTHSDDPSGTETSGSNTPDTSAATTEAPVSGGSGGSQDNSEAGDDTPTATEQASIPSAPVDSDDKVTTTSPVSSGDAAETNNDAPSVTEIPVPGTSASSLDNNGDEKVSEGAPEESATTTSSVDDNVPHKAQGILLDENVPVTLSPASSTEGESDGATTTRPLQSGPIGNESDLKETQTGEQSTDSPPAQSDDATAEVTTTSSISSPASPADPSAVSKEPEIPGTESSGIPSHADDADNEISVTTNSPLSSDGQDETSSGAVTSGPGASQDSGSIGDSQDATTLPTISSDDKSSSAIPEDIGGGAQSDDSTAGNDNESGTGESTTLPSKTSSTNEIDGQNNDQSQTTTASVSSSDDLKEVSNDGIEGQTTSLVSGAESTSTPQLPTSDGEASNAVIGQDQTTLSPSDNLDSKVPSATAGSTDDDDKKDSEGVTTNAPSVSQGADEATQDNESQKDEAALSGAVDVTTLSPQENGSEVSSSDGSQPHEVGHDHPATTFPSTDQGSSGSSSDDESSGITTVSTADQSSSATDSPTKQDTTDQKVSDESSGVPDSSDDSSSSASSETTSVPSSESTSSSDSSVPESGDATKEDSSSSTSAPSSLDSTLSSEQSDSESGSNSVESTTISAASEAHSSTSPVATTESTLDSSSSSGSNGDANNDDASVVTTTPVSGDDVSAVSADDAKATSTPEEQTTVSPIVAPVQSQDNEKDSTQAPVFGDEPSVSGDSTQSPVFGDEPSVSGDSTQSPVSGDSTQSSVSGDSTQSPVSGDSTQSPASGGIKIVSDSSQSLAGLDATTQSPVSQGDATTQSPVSEGESSDSVHSDDQSSQPESVQHVTENTTMDKLPGVTGSPQHDGEDIVPGEGKPSDDTPISSLTSGSTMAPKVGSGEGEQQNVPTESSAAAAGDSSTSGISSDVTTSPSIIPSQDSNNQASEAVSESESSSDRPATTQLPMKDSSDMSSVSTVDSDANTTSRPLQDSSESDVTTVVPNEKLSDSSVDTTTSGVSDNEDDSSRVPGEGSCFVEGKTYQNGSSIPPTTPCHLVCACQNSIVHCLLVHCPPPPNSDSPGDCKPIYKSGVCCPEYDCGETDNMPVTVTPGPGEKDETIVTVTPDSTFATTETSSQSSANSSESSLSSSTSEPETSSATSSSESSSSEGGDEGHHPEVSHDSTTHNESEPVNEEVSPVSPISTSTLISLIESTTLKPVTDEPLMETGGIGGLEGAPIDSAENTSSLFPQEILSNPFGEDTHNITGEDGSSDISQGSYYPVTTTTTVTPSSVPWPYPTSTPSSVMSTGACLFDGRVYMSAQQIPRDDPCDFCFCFRGDIICLQQSCPPPIPGCYEEPIPGFCCPRYECPVGNGNVTTQEPPLFPPSYYHNQILHGVASGQNLGPPNPPPMPTGPGCEIQGEYYESGQVITSTSGPCLECRCGATGMMECDPRECQPEPMLRKMIAAITSR